jgi:hypothetical protein
MWKKVAVNGRLRGCCLYALEHSKLVLWKHIEKSGNKHVARHATEGVDMNLHSKNYQYS